MVDRGSYTINGSSKRDTSFKNLICVLLVFLAMLILISLLMLAFKPRGSNTSSSANPHNDNYMGGNFSTTTTKSRTGITTHKTIPVETKTTFSSTSTTTTTDTTIPIQTTKSSTSQNTPSTTIATDTTISQLPVQPKTNSTAFPVTQTEKIQNATSTTLATSTVASTTTEKPVEVISTTEQTENSPGESDIDFITTTTMVPSTTTTKKASTTSTASTTTTKKTSRASLRTISKAGEELSRCEEGVCKRISASMLFKLNHEKMDYCKDPFNTVCFNPDEDEEDGFLKRNFKELIDKINQNASDDVKVLGDFYKMCLNYPHTINRTGRFRNLKILPITDYSETVAESILLQSMPFFDVGLNIQNDGFIIEMALPGVSYLKTNVKGWSLREQITEDCIVAVAGSIYQNIVELYQKSKDVDLCITETIKSYVLQFLDEIEQMSKLDGLEYLKEIVSKGGVQKDLTDIFVIIQQQLALYRTDFVESKKLTLKDLNDKYNLGFDWISMFKKLLEPHNVDENTKVLFSEFLHEVFADLTTKKNNITDMLNLWYNLQSYKNFVIERHIGNRGHYCMKLSSQLMPEVVSSLITDINNKRFKYNYDLMQTVMENLKEQFMKSLESAKFQQNSIDIMDKRMKQIKLENLKPFTMKNGNYPKQNTYENQLVELIKNYKKLLYTQVFKGAVTSDILLTLFVNIFDTNPRTFPPYRDIVFQPGFVYDITKDVPYDVILAKKGLPLAVALSRHFIRNDYDQPLNANEVTFYDNLKKDSDTSYLLEKSKYVVEKIECEIEDSSGKNLKYDSIVGDNMAFWLVSSVFLPSTDKQLLPFTDNFNLNETFVTVALQDFCKPNDLADFLGDYYKMEVPAPIKIKNIASNSKLFSDTFGCPFKDKLHFS